jgi:hypothetical protein
MREQGNPRRGGRAVLGDMREARDSFTSPRARGEVARRSGAPASGVSGRAHESEHIERAPHPDPLPANGEREPQAP